MTDAYETWRDAAAEAVARRNQDAGIVSEPVFDDVTLEFEDPERTAVNEDSRDLFLDVLLAELRGEHYAEPPRSTLPPDQVAHTEPLRGLRALLARITGGRVS